jgi:hypothetical protein
VNIVGKKTNKLPFRLRKKSLFFLFPKPNMQFEQTQSIVNRIQQILREYPYGDAVLLELMQNADDAKATDLHVHFDTTVTRTENAATRTPALSVYNNAEFTDNDLVNIQNIGGTDESSKRHDAVKVGRFGIGFNSCYHVTDVISFVSRQYVVVFDPSRLNLPKEQNGQAVGGLRFDFVETNKVVESKRLQQLPLSEKEQFFVELMDSFDEVRGYEAPSNGTQRRSFSRKEPFAGTLFRLPLRTKATPMWREVHSPDDILQLIHGFDEAARLGLVLTKNLQRVTGSISAPASSGSASSVPPAFQTTVAPPPLQTSSARSPPPAQRLFSVHSKAVSVQSQSLLYGTHLPKSRLDSLLPSDLPTPRNAIVQWLERYTKVMKELSANADQPSPKPTGTFLGQLPPPLSVTMAIDITVSKSESSSPSSSALSSSPVTVSRFLVAHQLGPGEGWSSTSKVWREAESSARFHHPISVPWSATFVEEPLNPTTTTSGPLLSSVPLSPPPPINGRLLCFFPIRSRTSLPVHIHGYFQLSSDRQSVKAVDSSLWNHALCTEVVPFGYQSAMDTCMWLLGEQVSPLQWWPLGMYTDPTIALIAERTMQLLVVSGIPATVGHRPVVAQQPQQQQAVTALPAPVQTTPPKRTGSFFSFGGSTTNSSSTKAAASAALLSSSKAPAPPPAAEALPKFTLASFLDVTWLGQAAITIPTLQFLELYCEGLVFVPNRAREHHYVRQLETTIRRLQLPCEREMNAGYLRDSLTRSAARGVQWPKSLPNYIAVELLVGCTSDSRISEVVRLASQLPPLLPLGKGSAVPILSNAELLLAPDEATFAVCQAFPSCFDDLLLLNVWNSQSFLAQYPTLHDHSLPAAAGAAAPPPAVPAQTAVALSNGTDRSDATTAPSKDGAVDLLVNHVVVLLQKVWDVLKALTADSVVKARRTVQMASPATVVQALAFFFRTKPVRVTFELRSAQQEDRISHDATSTSANSQAAPVATTNPCYLCVLGVVAPVVPNEIAVTTLASYLSTAMPTFDDATMRVFLQLPFLPSLDESGMEAVGVAPSDCVCFVCPASEEEADQNSHSAAATRTKERVVTRTLSLMLQHFDRTRLHSSSESSSIQPSSTTEKRLLREILPDIFPPTLLDKWRAASNSNNNYNKSATATMNSTATTTTAAAAATTATLATKPFDRILQVAHAIVSPKEFIQDLLAAFSWLEDRTIKSQRLFDSLAQFASYEAGDPPNTVSYAFGDVLAAFLCSSDTSGSLTTHSLMHMATLPIYRTVSGSVQPLRHSTSSSSPSSTTTTLVDPNKVYWSPADTIGLDGTVAASCPSFAAFVEDLLRRTTSRTPAQAVAFDDRLLVSSKDPLLEERVAVSCLDVFVPVPYPMWECSTPTQQQQQQQHHSSATIMTSLVELFHLPALSLATVLSMALRHVPIPPPLFQSPQPRSHGTAQNSGSSSSSSVDPKLMTADAVLWKQWMAAQVTLSNPSDAHHPHSSSPRAGGTARAAAKKQTLPAPVAVPMISEHERVQSDSPCGPQAHLPHTSHPQCARPSCPTDCSVLHCLSHCRQRLDEFTPRGPKEVPGKSCGMVGHRCNISSDWRCILHSAGFASRDVI